jgi:hypothetical protein
MIKNFISAEGEQETQRSQSVFLSLAAIKKQCITAILVREIRLNFFADEHRRNESSFLPVRQRGPLRPLRLVPFPLR